MDSTQSNRPDNLGGISNLGLIPLKAKLVPAAIRHETVPAHIRDYAVQRPKMVTPLNLPVVPWILRCARHAMNPLHRFAWGTI